MKSFDSFHAEVQISVRNMNGRDCTHHQYKNLEECIRLWLFSKCKCCEQLYGGRSTGSTWQGEFHECRLARCNYAAKNVIHRGQ